VSNDIRSEMTYAYAERLRATGNSVKTTFRSFQKNDTSRFTIPVRTLVSVCRVDDSKKQWQEYRTRRELRFERFESSEKGALIFREQGWLILTRAGRIKKRNARSN
jgi:hypothetical protein